MPQLLALLLGTLDDEGRQQRVVWQAHSD